MTKGTFLHEMKGLAINIENYTLFDKPTKLINWDTQEEELFKNVEEAYEKALINDKPLKEIVEQAETIDDLFGATLDDGDILFEE